MHTDIYPVVKPVDNRFDNRLYHVNGALQGHSSGDKEVQSLALQQLDCVEREMHQCTVLLKDKVLINDTIIASNIC